MKNLGIQIGGIIAWAFLGAAQALAQSRVGAGDDKTTNRNILSIQKYAVIDISKDSVTGPVSAVALDESSNGAFATVVADGINENIDPDLGSMLVTTETFSLGQIANVGQFHTVYTADQGLNWNFLGPVHLRPNGDWLGTYDIATYFGVDHAQEPDDPSIDPYFADDYNGVFRGGFIASGNSISALSSFPYVDNVVDRHAGYHTFRGNFWGASDTGFCIDARYSEIDMPGQAPFVLWPNGPYGYEGNGFGDVTEIFTTNSGVVFFDADTPARIPDISGPPASIRFVRQFFDTKGSCMMNDNGSVVTGWRDIWWDGQTLHSTNLPAYTTYAWNLTNENRMIGKLEDDDNKGFLWENGNWKLFSDLLIGTNLGGQFTQIIPVLASNENAIDHNYNIITRLKDSGENKLVLWENGPLLLPIVGMVLPLRIWHWFEMQFPPDAGITWENLGVINSSGVIAALKGGHALLLIPVGLRLLNGKTSDFDGQVIKHFIPEYINGVLENPLHDQQVLANNKTWEDQSDDTLGAKPLGEGRTRTAYAYDTLVAARAPNLPWLHYQWKRYVKLLEWNIRKSADHASWNVTKRRSRDWEDDAASSFSNEEPSTLRHEFYCYDNSALSYHPDVRSSPDLYFPSDDNPSSIGDWIYSEKVFEYIIRVSLDKPGWTEANAEWKDGASMFVSQTALVKQIGHTYPQTRDIRRDWQPQGHYFFEGYIEPGIDAQKIHKFIKDKLPINFEPDYNIYLP